MKGVGKPRTWTKSNVQNLYRHKSGVYYVRTWVAGKEKWKSLKTPLLSAAKIRMVEHVRHADGQRKAGMRLGQGKLTFRQAVEIYEKAVEANATLRPNSKRYRLKGLKLIERSWPKLFDMDVTAVTTTDCREWLNRFRVETLPHRPPGARGYARNSTGASATTVNCALQALQNVFEVALDNGAIGFNPARHKTIKRAKREQKPLTLPSKAQFRDFIAAVECIPSRHSQAAAEWIRFAAYTGARKNEANNVLWSDIDFKRGTVALRETKNRQPRWVPMIKELRELLIKMRAERAEELDSQRVLRVSECQKSMDAAAISVGMQRLTHHDLRHLFCTVLIEAGNDIPTVARIMGHKDGGALAMKTYGHLRDEHAQAAMKKVSFAP